MKKEPKTTKIKQSSMITYLYSPLPLTWFTFNKTKYIYSLINCRFCTHFLYSSTANYGLL